MSYPILYSATETDFDHNGIGILGDCVSCEVTEEANGAFELYMQYPMDGIHFSDITDRAIIKSKVDQFRNPQLFRVYAVSKPMSGIVAVLAEHISYDLSGIPVSPFSAESVATALQGLKANAVVDCPFSFWTDKATPAKFNVKTPASIRSRLGGSTGSILDVYGGEYEFDNYTVKLYNNRGMNRGVSIRYGKNLTDIQQDQNCSNVATGVYPYWADSEGNYLVELPEKIIGAPGTYNFVKIKTLDLSQNFETQPTEEQIRTYAENYVKANDIGVPSVSLTVSFAQLEQYEEYKHLKLLERVSLFDTVNVEFPALNVSATAKAVKVVYDSLADRVKSVTLGSARSNLADTIAEQQKEIERKPSVSVMQSIITSLTSAILGAKGGSVRILDTNGDGEPDTLYIADNPDPALAVKVWRFNYEGWGASQNGYNGPFTMGATLNDGLLAAFVTAANLVAGTIQSKDGKTFLLDLDNGILKMQATELSISGKTVDEIAQEKATVAENNAVAQVADIAKSAVDAQTQTDIFNKLTNNGETQGIYLKNGKIYINGTYMDVGVVVASLVSTGILKSKDGTTFYLDLDKGILKMNATEFSVSGKTVDSIAQEKADAAEAAAKKYADSAASDAVGSQTQADIFNKLTNNGQEQGIYIKDGKLYLNLQYLKTGTFKSTAMAYLDPGEEELLALRNHLLNNPKLPEDQIPLYDIDGDGETDITDMMQIRGIMLGHMSFAERPGAQMSEVTVTIDPSDSEKAIKITGTNQWGRDVEIYYGVNGTNARAAKSDFSVSGKLNVGGATTLNGPLIGYTGILYDTLPAVDDLEENQIILVKVASNG